MNDFENEDTLNDFEVEITDLDPDREKGRTSVLWLYGQGLWARSQRWMTLLIAVGMTILILILSSPSLPPSSHGSHKASDVVASHSLPQANPCSSSLVTFFIVQSNDHGTTIWYKAKESTGAAPTVTSSCAQHVTIQTVPGSHGSGSWYRKK